MNSDMIQVCFGLHDASGFYSGYVATVIQSIMEHTEAQVCFHIIHDDSLSQQNMLRLLEQAEKLGCALKFHEIDPYQYGEVQRINERLLKRFSVGAMFRLIAPDLFANLHKVIYLDADLLFNADIRELWETDIEGRAIAAVKDLDSDVNLVRKSEMLGTKLSDPYFNSGVMIMDLNQLRGRELLREFMEFITKYPEMNNFDQDFLNYKLGADVKILPASWNLFSIDYRIELQQSPENQSGDKQPGDKQLGDKQPGDKRAGEDRVNTDNLQEGVYHFAADKIRLQDMTTLDRVYADAISKNAWSSQILNQSKPQNQPQPQTRTQTQNQPQPQSRIRVSDEKTVQVCFGVHDKNGLYCGYVAAVMRSIMEHTKSDVCFHIIHDASVTREKRQNLEQLAEELHCRLRFYEIDPARYGEVDRIAPHLLARFSVGAMFRLIAADLFTDLHKVIYLDADLLFNTDILELWQTELGENTVAAVKDISSDKNVIQKSEAFGVQMADPYFNSGVMIMNLDQMRGQKLLQEFISFILKYPNNGNFDQAFLNYRFGYQARILPEKWNLYSLRYRVYGGRLEDGIYHFAADKIRLDAPTELDRLYADIIARTHWGQQILREKYRSYLDGCTRRINVWQLFTGSLMTAGRSSHRVFLGEQDNRALAVMKQILHAAEQDYDVTDLNQTVIDFTDGQPKPMLEVLKQKREQYLILIANDRNAGVTANQLEQLGYEEAEDFFNTGELATPGQGGLDRT